MTSRLAKMEKLKGLLKRRPGDIRTAANNFAEIEVVSDPENTAEIRPEPSSSPTNQDNTRALMMDKIDQLTNERYAQEVTLSELRFQVERATQENLNLQSKCDDLQKSLELEKRRSKWQQRFYEQRIQQLTGLTTRSTIDRSTVEPVNEESESVLEMSIDGDENDSGTIRRLRKYQSIENLLECNSFYEETIKALVQVQESQGQELNNLKTFYDDKLKALSLEHEVEVTEILESSNFEVQKLIRENEGLIRDLLTGCEGLFDQLKNEYTEEARTNTELKTSSGENIIAQFKGKHNNL